MGKVRYIDLFAGLGGIRIGFEQALSLLGLQGECVFTSEIKPSAVKTLKYNFKNIKVSGDITKVSASDIPNFDVLLGGFPCQAFSYAGKRMGFNDTRGTLFFDVARILKEKKPKGFILENVEGLVKHDSNPNNPNGIGRTLETILNVLQEIGYETSWRVLNAVDFGVPQIRKRIYIVGTRKEKVMLDFFPKKIKKVGSILEEGLAPVHNRISKLLLYHFTPEELYGKAINDKRGGKNNIHSWEIELKGPVSREQTELLNLLFKQRRRKKWAEEIGIKWMDGMPLTLEQISTFYSHDRLEEMLDDLVEKNYLRFEHPKDLYRKQTESGFIEQRDYATHLDKGYNIVAGKLSFDINRILDPNGFAPTLVALDMDKLFVIDNGNVRNLSIREGLRMFGFPESYSIINTTKKEAYDLLGNSVAVPVIKSVAERLLPKI